MQSCTSSRPLSDPGGVVAAAPASTGRGVALAIDGLTGPAGAPVLFDVSIAVRAGTTHVLLGPIHSGKSMLLRHVVGLENAERGTITVRGDTFDARGESRARLRLLRTRLGVVFEGSALVSRISVVENVELPLLEHTEATPAEAREAARELLFETGLEGAEEALPVDLGRLEARRVALARALALRPSVLLLDEPAIALDAHAAALLDDTIERLQATHGFGVLLASHEVRHAFGGAEEISMMVNGRIVAHGDPESLRQSEHEMVRHFLDRREGR